MATYPPITYEEVKYTLQRKGYNDTIPAIIGIRTRREVTDKFDDYLIFFCPVKDNTLYRVYSITTKPGLYYLANGNSKGTAVLKPGQYVGCYALGLHQGKYKALTQVRPVTVYRDANKDNITDYVNPDTGLFGINIHRSSPSGCSNIVHNWSAGCQVFQCIDDYNEFIGCLSDFVAGGGQNTFTYTLLELEDV